MLLLELYPMPEVIVQMKQTWMNLRDSFTTSGVRLQLHLMAVMMNTLFLKQSTNLVLLAMNMNGVGTQIVINVKKLCIL